MDAMDKKSLKILICTSLVAMAFPIGIWIASSYFEAKAFNRFSRTQATTWDAMWTTLRVVPD